MSGLKRKMARAQGRRNQGASPDSEAQKIQTYHLAPLLFIKVGDGYEVRLQGYPTFQVSGLKSVPPKDEIEEKFWRMIMYHIALTLDPKRHKPPHVYTCPQVIDIAAEHAGFEGPANAGTIETLALLLSDSNEEVRFVVASSISITWPEFTVSSGEVETLRLQTAAALHDASRVEPIDVNRRAMLAALETVLGGRSLEAVN